MLIDFAELCKKHSKNITNLSSIQCMVVDTCKKEINFMTDDGINFCSHCDLEYNKTTLHLYGSNEAYRWNGRYIYYCPKGLIFVAASLSDETGNMIGSITAGPIVMEYDDDISTDYFEDKTDHKLKHYFSSLPHLTTSKVNSFSELLSLSSISISKMPPSKVGAFVYEQEKLLNTVYNINSIYSKSDCDYNYPILYEKQLHQLIISRDKKGAQKLFNELLAHVFLSSDYDLEIIKVRVIELVVLLSRATIDGGASINEIFCFNSNYIKRIEQFTDIEDLSLWLTGVLNRFFNYLFDFTEVKHSDIVFKVIQYIKLNYTKKLVLDDIAKTVYLSSSYLSTIFKEETKQSLTSFINTIRVEKSKLFMLDDNLSLVDIANLCGFDNQSYFTKVFKKITGLSPKAYRLSRGNLSIKASDHNLVSK